VLHRPAALWLVRVPHGANLGASSRGRCHQSMAGLSMAPVGLGPAMQLSRNARRWAKPCMTHALDKSGNAGDRSRKMNGSGLLHDRRRLRSAWSPAGLVPGRASDSWPHQGESQPDHPRTAELRPRILQHGVLIGRLRDELAAEMHLSEPYRTPLACVPTGARDAVGRPPVRPT